LNNHVGHILWSGTELLCVKRLGSVAQFSGVAKLGGQASLAVLVERPQF